MDSLPVKPQGKPLVIEGDIYVVEELFGGTEPGRDLKRRSASFSPHAGEGSGRGYREGIEIPVFR